MSCKCSGCNCGKKDIELEEISPDEDLQKDHEDLDFNDPYKKAADGDT